MKMLYVLATSCTQTRRIFCTSAAHSETYVKRTPSSPTRVSKFSSHIYDKINLHSADISVNHMKALFWLGFMFLMQISRLHLILVIKNAHPTYLCFGSFCKFFGDF